MFNKCPQVHYHLKTHPRCGLNLRNQYHNFSLFLNSDGSTKLFPEELKVLHLLVRVSTTLTMPPHLFALVILDIESPFLSRPTWTRIFLFYASHYYWDNRHAPPNPDFSHWDVVWQTFLPKLYWNHDPDNLSLLNSKNYTCEPPGPS
jgi:hypothetical protein